MSVDLKIIALTLAVAFQIQATLPLSQTGIRVSLADICLPILLGVLLARRQFDPFSKLSWTVPRTWIWLAAITAVMTAALLTGYVRTGEWSSWGLVNKYAGWFVLMTYFVLGGALASLGGAPLRDGFVKTFILFAAAVAAINTLAMPVLFGFYTLPAGIEYSRITGLMKNSNAFGFLIVVALALHLAGGRSRKDVLAILISALWFTASRGALIALAAMVVAFLLGGARGRLKPLAAGCLIAAGVIAGVSGLTVVYQNVSGGTPVSLKPHSQPLGLLGRDRIDPGHVAIEERSKNGSRAIEIISRSPMLGMGLGGFVAETGGTLHNSLLWLVIEMGLIGAGVFVAFLMTALWMLYRNRDGPLQLGMFAVALAFMAISLTSEFLYQRHLWFLLGMALVKPRKATAAS